MTQIIRERRAMQAWADARRAQGLRIGFVPTMGALHEGHLELVRRARADGLVTVASIFVNPTQFAPGEDLEAYPRTFEADRAALEALGVDVIFAPSAGDMYPFATADSLNGTWVEVPALAADWCGRSRPVFFRGVATVVSKLFHAVKPHVAYFGTKDYQQLAVVRRMTQELLWDIEIVGVPTVREADGLAMSSRNVYMQAGERAAAPAIFAALLATQGEFAAGERDAAVLGAALRRRLEAIPGAVVDYVGIADPETLAPLPAGEIEDGQLMAAVWMGQARLLDNLPLDPARLAGLAEPVSAGHEPRRAP